MSALSPGGVRLGAPALTSRSFKENDFVCIAEFLHEAVQLTLRAQEAAGSKMMKDFVVALQTDTIQVEIAALRERVQA